MMDDILVIGGGPAGLFSAWLAHQRGARVRVLAAGIGTTHIMPGWIGLLHTEENLAAALADWVDRRPAHPYARAGLNALHAGVAALQKLCEPAGIRFVGSFERNMRLPTALGAALTVAFAPESFAAGNLSQPGAMLIAGPAGWRDFYPALCAANLSRQGFAAEPFAFDLPEIQAVKFDSSAVGLARLFDRGDVRERVAAQIRARLDGAATQKSRRVGMPAVLGLDDYPQAWRHLQDLIGVPIFEIPTLPPSVPGMRLYDILGNALARAGVQVLLNMPVSRGLVEDAQVSGAVVQSVVRETVYRARNVILATGGLYGGGITSNHRGELAESVLGLPLTRAPAMSEWFGDRFLPAEHAIHNVGVPVNNLMQPTNQAGQALYENLRAAGRLLSGYNAPCEGSTEGVWLATAYRAVSTLLD
jgi:glycerol-3-phosphate dehydrogenase subunit B